MPGKTQKAILNALVRRPNGVRLQALSEELGIDARILNPPIARLEKAGYVERFKGTYRKKQKQYVKITKPKGRDFLRYGKDNSTFLSDPSGYRGVSVYRESLELWEALKFKKVTVGHGEREIWDKEEKVKKTIPFINRKRPINIALRDFVDKYKNVDMFFTPAETWVGKGSVLNFIRSHCLWFSSDLPLNNNDQPLTAVKRHSIIVSKTQRLIKDELHPFAIIESGYDFHVLLMVQNYMKNDKRLNFRTPDLGEG